MIERVDSEDAVRRSLTQTAGEGKLSMCDFCFEKVTRDYDPAGALESGRGYVLKIY